MLKLNIFLAVVATSLIPVLSQGISNPEEICPKSCLEPKSAHPECGLNLKRWYFNRESKKCESFKYGGCSGNGNRFESKAECMDRCGACPAMDIPDDPSDDPSCACQYFPLDPYNGGCRITEAPPQGYKCQCIFGWYDWKCMGLAVKCANYEICPANCKTKECCELGVTELAGDCGGYYNQRSGVRSNQIIKTPKKFPTKFEEFERCLVGTNTPLAVVVDQKSNPALYTYLKYQWNLQKEQVTPIAFFVPKTTEHVSNAVKCGVQSKIPLIPRSGGHSFEAYSYGTNDSIIIDFRDMDELVVDEEEGTARIGPGALLGPVNVKLFKYNYALPMGNCFTVALGGHAIGGGFGVLSNIYGLTLDNVLEQTMVDANGVIHIANATQNKELYWALRGQGAGYIGLVTDFKVKLKKTFIPKSQLHGTESKTLLMSVGLNTYPLSNAQTLFTVWDSWLDWTTRNDPTTISSITIAGNSFKNNLPGRLNPIAVGISAQAVHTEMATGAQLLPPQPNKTFSDGFKQYWASNGIHSMVRAFGYKHVVLTTQHTPIIRDNYTKPLTVDEILHLKGSQDLPRYFKIKSFYVTKKMSLMDVDRISEVVQRIPSQSVWVFIDSESGFIHTVPKDATAYVHRTSRYSVVVQYEGPDDPVEVANGLKWIEEFVEAWKPLDNGETYQNFPDNALLENDVYLKRYYGSNLDRLKRVKAKYDPHNYFVDPASIPVDIMPGNIDEDSDSDSSQSGSDEN